VLVLGETAVAVHDEGYVLGDVALLHDVEGQLFEGCQFEHQ
jgi:hypothetical protein